MAYCYDLHRFFHVSAQTCAPVKPKKPIDLDEDPAVPAQLTWSLNRILVGAQYVSVKETANNGKSHKGINGCALKSRDKMRPEESADDIALMVCRMMQARWEEKNLAGEMESSIPLMFRIELQAPTNPKSTRPYIDWKWDPGDTYDDNEDTMRSFEHMVLRDLIDSTNSASERDRLYIGEMQDRFLKMAELNAEPIKQTGEQLTFANALSLQGMTALVNAAQMTYSYEHHKSLEAEKTERWKMVVDNLGPFAKIAAAQMMAFVGNKVSGANIDNPRGAAPDGQPRKTPPPPPDDEEFVAPDADEDETADEADDDVDEQNPIATTAEVFGDLITVRQRKELRGMLTAAEFEAVNALAESADDAQAVERYVALKDMLAPATLIQLVVLLDDDQRTLFESLQRLVKKALEPDEEPEADPDEEDPGGDPEDDPEDTEGDSDE